MSHHLGYVKDGVAGDEQLVLSARGSMDSDTAMAKTVGLPLAMATKLILERKITSRGVCIPIVKEFYEPILKELEQFDIGVDVVSQRG